MMDRDRESAIDSLDDDGGIRPPEFLKDPIRAIRRRRNWMLVAGIIGLVATTLFSLALKPRFRASATVLVSSQQIPEEFVRPTVRDDSLERINAMVGNILSKSKLSRLIEKYDLYPSLREELPASEVVEIMRDDVEIGIVPGFTSGHRSETASRYSISFTADVPEIAADVANDLAAFFTESSIEMREQQARLTTEFLRRQLDSAERDLREHERKIREFKERYRGELPDELAANLHKLEQLQLQRQSLAMQTASGETRLAMLLTPADSSSPEARLAALKGRLAEESSVYTDEHPSVTSLRRQIATLEREIQRSSKSPSEGYVPRAALIAAERRAQAEIRKQREATEAQLQEIDARVANTPKRQEELGALEGKASVLRDTYREFLTKVQDAELAQNLESAQQGERVVILDRAEPPGSPIRERWRYVVGGILASFGFSLAVGIVLELADPVVVSSDHVESAFGLPVLGSVYRIS
jgi:succinoglycan biosynthesis transport protein ExoP